MNLGKTRQINFYNMDDDFYFVDLPGYGFSKMSKQEQEKVGSFIEEYLFGRKNIALIIFLVDIRHTPSANDKMMYDYIIKANHPFIILASKADKIAVTKVTSATQDIQNVLNPLHDITTLPFSADRKIYSDDVWNEISKFLV